MRECVIDCVLSATMNSQNLWKMVILSVFFFVTVLFTCRCCYVAMVLQQIIIYQQSYPYRSYILYDIMHEMFLQCVHFIVITICLHYL